MEPPGGGLNFNLSVPLSFVQVIFTINSLIELENPEIIFDRICEALFWQQTKINDGVMVLQSCQYFCKIDRKDTYNIMYEKINRRIEAYPLCIKWKKK